MTGERLHGRLDLPKPTGASRNPQASNPEASRTAGSAAGGSVQENLDESDGVGERREVARRDVLGLDAEAVADEAVHERDWEEAVVRRRDPSRRDRRQGR